MLSKTDFQQFSWVIIIIIIYITTQKRDKMKFRVFVLVSLFLLLSFLRLRPIKSTANRRIMVAVSLSMNTIDNGNAKSVFVWFATATGTHSEFRNCVAQTMRKRKLNRVCVNRNVQLAKWPIYSMCSTPAKPPMHENNYRDRNWNKSFSYRSADRYTFNVLVNYRSNRKLPINNICANNNNNDK